MIFSLEKHNETRITHIWEIKHNFPDEKLRFIQFDRNQGVSDAEKGGE